MNVGNSLGIMDEKIKEKDHLEELRELSNCTTNDELVTRALKLYQGYLLRKKKGGKLKMTIQSTGQIFRYDGD